MSPYVVGAPFAAKAIVDAASAVASMPRTVAPFCQESVTPPTTRETACRQARVRLCSRDGFGFLARQPPRDDLGDAVAAHGHAVEDVGGFHRPLLMCDDDELRTIAVLPQQRDEAADDRLVECRLDLVEERERARPREEEREEERARAERLLAAGEQRQPLHLLADRAQMDFDAGLRLLVLRLDQLEPALAAREERAGDLGEMRLHSGERLCEARLDRLGQLVAQLLELLERLLEVGALRRQLLEPLLLRVVLLLRKWG